MMLLAHILLLIFLVKTFSAASRNENSDGFDAQDGYDSYEDLMNNMRNMNMDGYGSGMDAYASHNDFGKPSDAYDDYEDNEIQPAYTILESVQEAQSWASDTEPNTAAIIGYFNEETHKEDLRAFKEVAERQKGTFRWAYITSKAALDETRCKGACVSLHRAARLLSTKQEERGRFRYPGQYIKSNGLESWALEKAPPLVGELSKETDKLYESSSLPTLIFFSDIDAVKDPKAYQYLHNRAVKVAEAYIGKLLVALARTSDHVRSLTVDYGLRDLVHAKTNTVGVGIRHGNKRWTLGLDQPFSLAHVEQFVQDYQKGALGQGRQAMRSTKAMSESEVDALNASRVEPVAVTEENFETVVRNSIKHTLIEFYAPWCGHCRALAPEYAQVAKHYASHQNVVIAAMDADTHRPPQGQGFDISGYPTIMLLRAGDSHPIPYQGEREAADIIVWMEDQLHSKADSV